MQKLNFKKLIDANPYYYKEFKNVKGQQILLAEHPYQGDEYPVIIMFPDFKAAFCSDFWDIDDMIYENSEYQPIYHEEEKECYYLFEYEQ